MNIAPLNIVMAALATQFFLVVIMFIGVALLRREVGYFSALLLVLALLTLGPFLFTDELNGAWGPMFGDAAFPTMKASRAMFFMFVLDSLCVGLMVKVTGGGRQSAFTAIFFTLPPLAIFLREPLIWLIFYLVLVSLLFSASLFVRGARITSIWDDEDNSPAFWFVAIACLVLTTFVGYVTRLK